MSIFPELPLILEKIQKDQKVSISGLSDTPLGLFIFEISSQISPVIFLGSKKELDFLRQSLALIIPEATFIDDEAPYLTTSGVILALKEFWYKKIKIKKPIELIKGSKIAIDELILRLEASGYTSEEIVEDEGEYARRGGILDIYVSKKEPLRIEFYGDTIESLRIFDPQTQRSIKKIESFSCDLVELDNLQTIGEFIKTTGIIITSEMIEHPGRVIYIVPQAEIDFHFTKPRKYFGDLRAIKQDLERKDFSYKFLLKRTLAEKLSSLIGYIEFIELPVNEGFVDERRKVIYLSENEIFGTIPRKKERFRGLFIDDLKGLKIDEYVVHNDYGIGIFRGLAQIDFQGEKVECLKIEYADNAKVYLPIERLNQLERYIGTSEHPPRLSKIGGDLWIKTKQRVKKATELLAYELINLYARRKITIGFSFSKDGWEMQELEAGFGYEETPDQKKAIEDVKRDMESPHPQERLICGDVGFGKTEIALRAAFKAALDGKQTLFLCPTTILAFQHYNTFKNRLKNFPLRVGMVSRFLNKTEIKKLLGEIKEGKIDIVIGTHRLLMPDIVFNDLGLLIIDEEQRFGVMQKERIKKLNPCIDIIYLSATPIPRSLYMGLSGIKDISIINTPPRGRKDIITRIIYFDEEEIKKIIQFELERNGQIFFVHNRIQTIETIKAKLHRILPQLRICLLHGKIKSKMSEKKMLEFLDGKYDLLLSTAIVESGIDMPRVNTIIVNEADKFGIADLHQLRGRVGRSDIQGYAYFIIPSKRLTEQAQNRLSAIISYTTLGSGFRLAIRDMEIRGIGNILGKEQSGFVSSIGYHHYIKILNNVVNEIQGKETTIEPMLNLKIPGYLPSEYILSAYERTALYKRLMDVQSEYELAVLKEEILDRFGKYPKQVANLFLIAELRLKGIAIGATEVVQKGKEIIFYSKNQIIQSLSITSITP